MSFLNICLTRLICPRADIQDDAVLIMWSLNESLLSNTTPMMMMVASVDDDVDDGGGVVVVVVLLRW